MKKFLILFLGGNMTLVWNKEAQKMAYPGIDTPEAVDHPVKNLIQTSYLLGESVAEYKVICFKDSSEYTPEDRAHLLDAIRQSEANHVIVVHGADTIQETAAYLKGGDLEEKIIALVSSDTPACITDRNENNDDESFVNLQAVIEDPEVNGVYTCIAGGAVSLYEETATA